MSKFIDNKVSNLVVSKLIEFLGPDVSEAVVLRIKEKYAIDINEERAVITNPELVEQAFMDLLGAVAVNLLEQINHDLINSFSKDESSDLQNIEDPKFSNYIKMMVETASTVDQKVITTNEIKKSKSVKPEEIFSILSDGPTIKILKYALIGFPADSFWTDIDLTRKQYYDRLHKLREIDLIRRRNNVYKVTALGQIIVHVILGTVEEIATNYWELKALESFRYTVPPEERSKIINSMLSNTKIKEYLL